MFLFGKMEDNIIDESGQGSELSADGTEAKRETFLCMSEMA